jgi:hypothetical protein
VKEMKDHLTKSGSIVGEDLEVRLPKDQIKSIFLLADIKIPPVYYSFYSCIMYPLEMAMNYYS